MSATIKITGWLLMTVMHSGQLKTAEFPTEALCRDGESLSVYGETVAEHEITQMKHRVEAEVDQALWEIRHPRHEPATDAEWDAVRIARNQPDVWTNTGGKYPNLWPRSAPGWLVYEDGTIKKARTFAVLASVSSFSVGPSDWITTTRCVPVPESEK